MQTPKRKPPQFAGLAPDPFVTEEKLAELRDKLQKLKRALPAARVEVARLGDLGDFSENAGYQFAKGRLRGLNSRIAALEAQIDSAKVIEKPKSNQTVQVGHKVTISDGKKEKSYQILGSSQTDPGKGLISYASPLGSALVGKAVGESIVLSQSGVKVEYKIIAIG